MTKHSNKSRTKEDQVLEEEGLSIDSEVEEVVDDSEPGSGEEDSQRSNNSGTGRDLAGDTVLGTTVVFVSDECCRAIYTGVGTKYTQNPYVCMGKMPCRGRAGGQGHKSVILKRTGQAKEGYYQGAFFHGNLFAARGGTLLTAKETTTLLTISKEADRAHANALNNLMGDPISTPPSPELLTLGQEDTTPPAFTPQATPNLASGGTVGQAELLQVMMNLCTTMKDMGKAQEATSAALISSMNEVKQSSNNNTYPSILKPPSNLGLTKSHILHEQVPDTGTDINSAINSRTTRDPGIGLEVHSSSSDSEDHYKPKERSKAKVNSKLSTSKKSPEHIFALANGRGGSISVGLYLGRYDKLSFLVEGFKKGRMKKVSSSKEGIKYINLYYKDK